MERLFVYAGCMFAGKTEALIKHLSQAQDVGFHTLALKPNTDTRYAESEIVSHGGRRLPALNVDPTKPFEVPKDIEVVGLDEAQFFAPTAISSIERLLTDGVTVVAAGLDLTCKAEPFGIMPQLLAMADHVTKLHATCSRCGRPATRSQRLVASQETILVGGADSYEPRCTLCFKPPL